MKVTVKLFASLRTHNEKQLDLDLPQGATPGDIMKKMDIPQDHVAIIMVNGLNSSRDTHLDEGDVVSLFPSVGGG